MPGARYLAVAIAVGSMALPGRAWAQTSQEEAPPPDRLSIGTEGFFRPGMLLQGWFLFDHADATTSTFRIRRAELSVKGEIVPHRLAYQLMIDPAKVLEFGSATLDVENQDPPPSDPDAPESVTVRQPVSAVAVFQDVYLTLLTDYVEVSLGQFKIPVSWEGYGSSKSLLFPERATVSRTFGDRRDIGLRLSKQFARFGYSAGVFNGAGLNNLDTNNDKDVALRLEAYPIDGLVVAGVIYASIGDRDSNVRDRYEGDVRFERGPLLVQAEYIRAHDSNAGGDEVDAHGFYAAVAWTLWGVLQPCARFGALDPDVDQDLDGTGTSDELWQLDLGLNYYFRQQEAKAQLAYSRFQFGDRTPTDEVILAAQLSF